MTSHLNNLNKNLQGRGNIAHSLLEAILLFEQQLTLLVQDMENGQLLHFETLRDYRNNSGCNINSAFFVTAIVKMQESFSTRFKDFRSEKPTLSFLTKPLVAKVCELNFTPFPTIDRAQFELQLLDLKNKDLWTEKFINLQSELENLARVKGKLAVRHQWTDLSKCRKEEEIIFETWNCLPDFYDQVKTYAFGILTIFGSTYYCEQLFSNMTII